jgi:hypothetical protein
MRRETPNCFRYLELLAKNFLKFLDKAAARQDGWPAAARGGGGFWPEAEMKAPVAAAAFLGRICRAGARPPGQPGPEAAVTAGELDHPNAPAT